MISILHLFNLNDLVISVILKTKTKTKANIQNWGNKHFDRKPKNKKQKRIKSKSIQPKKKKMRVLRCVWNNLSQFNWQRGLRILE